MWILIDLFEILNLGLSSLMKVELFVNLEAVGQWQCTGLFKLDDVTFPYCLTIFVKLLTKVETKI